MILAYVIRTYHNSNLIDISNLTVKEDVDIWPYNSLTNCYTVPALGMVHVYSTTTNGYMDLHIYDSKNVQIAQVCTRYDG